MTLQKHQINCMFFQIIYYLNLNQALRENLELRKGRMPCADICLPLIFYQITIILEKR